MAVLVYSDDPNTELELITLTTKLGQQADVAVLGAGDLSEQTKKASVNGVARIFQVSHDSLKDSLTSQTVDALEAVFKSSNPDLVLIGSTRRGKEVAPKLATRLKIGYIADALKVEMSGKDTSAQRLVWGGNSIATVQSRGAAVATIPLRAYERASGSSSPTVEKVDFQPKPSKVLLVAKKEKEKREIGIKDADVIVSAGRGFKKKEDLAILDDLVKVLNGALGASRPLASDLGWLPEERQVGLSGTTVKPKLYIAVGISGQIQHLTGMRDSKVVVAINTDKNAAIFQECDYGAVGDLYQIVPELVKTLKARLG